MAAPQRPEPRPGGTDDDYGIVVSGVGAKSRFSWAVGGFNDWIESSAGFDESAKQLVGRFTEVPLVTEDKSNLLHLSIAARYSDAQEGLRYATEPEQSFSHLRQHRRRCRSGLRAPLPPGSHSSAASMPVWSCRERRGRLWLEPADGEPEKE